MRFVAESWVVNEPAAKADAIVVLSDDNFYADRATHAAELFRQGAAPVVIASGRRLRPSAGIVELMNHDLIERGVPKESILPLAHDAENTRDEAMTIGRFAAEHHRRNSLLSPRIFTPAVPDTSSRRSFLRGLKSVWQAPGMATLTPSAGGKSANPPRNSSGNCWEWWLPCGNCAAPAKPVRLKRLG